MVDRLHVDVERVLGMSKLHDAVSESLGGLHPADAPALAASHGVVASPVSSAVGSVLANRGDILRSTSTSGQQISGLLQGAADAYRSGDEEGARRMTAAAQAMDGPPGLGSAASGPATPGGAASGAAPATVGTEQLGQALGQIGQVVQSVAQPIQGLAQALGQLPGQLFGGLGGMAGGGGLGDAADLGTAMHGAPMDHSTPVHHSTPMGHAMPGHHGGGGAGHPGDTDPDHAHELTRDDHDRDDDPPTDPDQLGESDESSDAAQELNADAPPARRPASTVPQD